MTKTSATKQVLVHQVEKSTETPSRQPGKYTKYKQTAWKSWSEASLCTSSTKNAIRENVIKKHKCKFIFGLATLSVSPKQDAWRSRLPLVKPQKTCICSRTSTVNSCFCSMHLRNRIWVCRFAEFFLCVFCFEGDGFERSAGCGDTTPAQPTASQARACGHWPTEPEPRAVTGSWFDF